MLTERPFNCCRSIRGMLDVWSRSFSNCSENVTIHRHLASRHIFFQQRSLLITVWLLILALYVSRNFSSVCYMKAYEHMGAGVGFVWRIKGNEFFPLVPFRQHIASIPLALYCRKLKTYELPSKQCNCAMQLGKLLSNNKNEWNGSLIVNVKRGEHSSCPYDIMLV